MYSRPDRILPKDPNEPINYHNLEPGDTIIFDTQTPVRDGTLGIVTHVADNGVDAFILSTVRPFHANAIVHMQDPRLTDTTIRSSMLGRGVFRLTAATEKLRTLVFILPAVQGEVVRLRSEVKRLCKIIDPPKPDEEEEVVGDEQVAETSAAS